MSLILLILGLLLTAIGIATIGFGIPINEFNLGNTLIVSGTTAAAAGLILIGLSAAVDQLTQIAKALRPRAGARPVSQPQAAEQAVLGGVRPGAFPVQAQGSVAAQVKAAVPLPPRGGIFGKPKAEDRAGEAAPAESEGSFSAIERLRSSLGRADRKADAADAEDHASGAPAAADRGTNGAAPPGGARAEPLKKPPLDFLFRSKSREAQPEPFDAVWPKPDHRDEQALTGEAPRPAAPEAPIDRPSPSEMSPASAPDDVRPAAILKSGVVDGMAYTLYADGSIEAQLPQGTVRFGSIAELRSHIENNS